MHYESPNKLYYGVAQAASWVAAKLIFKRKFLRNDIKGKQGPFVVIANHGAMLDFVNLIGATNRPMSFVISNSFYSSMPIQGFLRKMGLIPKQQFQTAVKDLKRMKSVIEHGEPVVIYPAGLMCEDGLSTPIPAATYKFLKWLDADVYVARSRGTYFVMPKWGKGIRPGRTYMDIYQLFSKEELAQTDLATVRRKTDEALLFDTYREQEADRVKYLGGGDIRGLENVLYICPHCGKEFTMEVSGKRTIRCTACGYAQTGDAYGFLQNESGLGKEFRYVSDWSRWIYERTLRQLQTEPEHSLTMQAQIRMIDPKKHKFVPVGNGTVTLSEKGFMIDGQLREEPIKLEVSIGGVPTLPFSPGKHFEIQDGSTIYRCVPEDGRQVIKCIHMVKAFYELNSLAHAAR